MEINGSVALVTGANSDLGTAFTAAQAAPDVSVLVNVAGGGGAMVNMLSVTSWAAVHALSGYSVAKAAEWSLTNSLRQALAGDFGAVRLQNVFVPA
jgi:NAD(P)-dependent dehydrogenase (short-subunit alcohol dehydrogenase family)